MRRLHVVIATIVVCLPNERSLAIIELALIRSPTSGAKSNGDSKPNHG
jgi:hypothetical protein